MNIVAFLGSQHGTKGATGRLLERAVQAAAEAGAQVRTISLADLDVAPCKACDVCHKTGECATKDDFQQIRDAMLSAEGIILASPNYLSSVTAQLKALMDRCCGIKSCIPGGGCRAKSVRGADA